MALILSDRFLAVLLMLVVSNAAHSCETRPLPPGANMLGYKKVAFDLCPKTSDISMSGRGTSTPLYNGVWWQKAAPLPSLYTDTPSGALSISLGGAVATVPTTMVPGLFPLLSGAHGFYVEFDVRLSENDRDHFPAVWLMPIEHRLGQPDSYPPDPPGYERWLEIDVDEGGFTPGPMATAIAWEGKWPDYKRTRSNPNLKNAEIDRTVIHRYGAGFDPKKLEITFWYDDKVQYVASGPSVPEVAQKQNFYAIMNANTHGKKTPYTMEIHRVRAFVPN